MAVKIRIQRKFSLTTPIDYRDLSGIKRHSGHPRARPARFDGNWRTPVCAVPPFRHQAAIKLQPPPCTGHRLPGKERPQTSVQPTRIHQNHSN
jgi:hypothetical protein